MRIGTVGVIGAGTMGTGIATNLAQHGLEVRLVDSREGAAAAAREQARTFYARAAEKGRIRASTRTPATA